MPKAKTDFFDKDASKSGKNIDNGIKRLRGIAANMNNLVQGLAVAILLHDNEHGDCTRALRLVEALPNSSRRAMLVNWFAYYGNIGMDVKGGKVRHIPENTKPISEGGRLNTDPFNKRLDAAKANPWYNDDAVPGQSSEVLPYTFGDFQNDIVSFTDRLRKRLENGKVGEREVQLTDEQKAVLKRELDKVDEVVREMAPANQPGTKGERQPAVAAA